MYLVADNPSLELGVAAPANFSRWKDFPVSQLSHHGQQCCDIARHWFRGMDFAQLNGSDAMSGPRWIRQKFDWGPSKWPLHWCEALEADAVDCGAHAALAQEAFEARGVTTYRAQIVQSYGGTAVDQWRRRWGNDDVSDHWLGEGFIYHEANAVEVGGQQVKLWDGSSGCWLNPAHTKGYGSVIAIRIWTPDGGGLSFRWGDHQLPSCCWQETGV